MKDSTPVPAGHANPARAKYGSARWRPDNCIATTSGICSPQAPTYWTHVATGLSCPATVRATLAGTPHAAPAPLARHALGRATAHSTSYCLGRGVPGEHKEKENKERVRDGGDRQSATTEDAPRTIPPPQQRPRRTRQGSTGSRRHTPPPCRSWSPPDTRSQLGKGPSRRWRSDPRCHRTDLRQQQPPLPHVSGASRDTPCSSA